MRRLVFPVIAAIGLVVVGPSSAFADDPAPTVSVKATAGKKVCKVTDPKLGQLSGIVATKTGFIVVNGSTDVASHKKIFYLDTKCKIVDEKSYSGGGPRDTEDMVLSSDEKTLWIADIGDNSFSKEDGTRRDTIGVWKMPVDGTKPTLYRLTYPQGDYHDAEALLINGTTPLIITREIGKAASIYEPSGPLSTGKEGVPLRKAGSITVSATETVGNPYARIGNKTIDGAAIAPGGGKVVLRTYTDALEYDVTGGDVLGALLKNKPRYTGLPNETRGEAITYSADGKLFYTVSNMAGNQDTANYILSYAPSTEAATIKKASSSDAGGKKWYADLTIDQITYAVGAVGLIGLILVGAGVMGIVRHRKRVALLPSLPDRDAGDPGDPETELIGVGGAPQRADVFGAAARSGPVYGGQQAAGPQRGGVYGGSGGAPQYARPQGGQPRGPQGGQPRGPQQGQPRGPQQGGQGGRNGVYGPPSSGAGGGGAGSGGGGGAGQYGQPRGPQQGQRPQRPAGPQGGGQAPRPQAGGGGGGQTPRPPAGGGGGQTPRPPQGQRPPQGGGPRQQGGYGKQGGRPPQRGDDYADDRYDNPGYRR